MAEPNGKIDMPLGARNVEETQVRALRFERAGFYVIVSVLAWRRFWALADRNEGNPNAQLLSWLAICLALWLTGMF